MTSARLYNPDLAPVAPEKRTWGTWHIASLWVGMAVCIPTYMLASSMIQGGMNWWQAMLTVALGNVIVLVPMVLNAHAGTRYGVPYPVLARASFGVHGANVPAMLRAGVACGWFGIQTWIGGAGIYTLVRMIWPGAAELPRVLPASVGLETGPLLCFLLFWAVNLYFIWRGTDSIKWLETLSAPFLILSGLALLLWAWIKADGFGPILAQPSRFEVTSQFWHFFAPSLTAMVGFWATLSLNIPDFTRYARDQRAQILGQAIGLPPTMILFAFIGVAVTSATPIIFGETIWDPVALVGRFENPILIVTAMIALSVATLSTNVAANVVGPANDFSNLAPSRISFRVGGTITGVIGIFMMPWKLLADPSGYIFTWLVGYSALLGPIAGVMLCDYYLIRGRRLDVDDLYREHGRYRYRSGFNPRALLSLALGVLPNVPGFLAVIGAVPGVPGFFRLLYSYAWFVGLVLAGGTYYALSAETRREAASDRVQAFHVPGGETPCRD